jgi:hypothetical protein
VSPWGGFIRKVARGAWHRDAKAFGNGGAVGCKVLRRNCLERRCYNAACDGCGLAMVGVPGELHGADP